MSFSKQLFPGDIAAETDGVGNIGVLHNTGYPQKTYIQFFDSSGSAIEGKYWFLNTPTTQYVIWYKISTGTAPALGPSYTYVEVDMVVNSSAAFFANQTYNALNALVGSPFKLYHVFFPSQSDNIIITNSAVGVCANAADGNTGFNISTLQIGVDNGVNTQLNRKDKAFIKTSVNAPLYTYPDDHVNDANAAQDVTVQATNKTAGTGNGGNLLLKGGTSSGGTAGQVQLETAGTQRWIINEEGNLLAATDGGGRIGIGHDNIVGNRPLSISTSSYANFGNIAVLSSQGESYYNGYIGVGTTSNDVNGDVYTYMGSNSSGSVTPQIGFAHNAQGATSSDLYAYFEWMWSGESDFVANGDVAWWTPTGVSLILRADHSIEMKSSLSVAGIAKIGSLGVGNSAAATTPGTVTKKIEVFDASGTSLGFVAVYDTIT